MANDSTKITDIITFFVNLYGEGDYKVINAYNNDQEIDLNGVIAITLSNYELLHHGNSQDYKITVNINGQFLTTEDVNQMKIIGMFEYIQEKTVQASILAGFEDIAGAIIQGGTIESDGEVNTCSYSVDLYFCKD